MESNENIIKWLIEEGMIEPTDEPDVTNDLDSIAKVAPMFYAMLASRADR